MVFTEYVKQAFLLVVILSAIPLLVSSLVGLVVALVQAATQIQEQSIQFVIKLAALCMVLFFLSEWGTQQLTDFVRNILGSVEELGRI